MEKGYVYILKCADGHYYTGSTNNIEIRLGQHSRGEGASYTRKRLPFRLVFMEEFSRMSDAFLREQQIKGWSRKKKEALISGDFNKLVELAQKGDLSTGSRPGGCPLAELVEAYRGSGSGKFNNYFRESFQII